MQPAPVVCRVTVDGLVRASVVLDTTKTSIRALNTAKNDIERYLRVEAWSYQCAQLDDGKTEYSIEFNPHLSDKTTRCILIHFQLAMTNIGQVSGFNLSELVTVH